MDEAELNASLLAQNERLRCEVEDLRTLQSVVKENLGLRSKLDGFPLTGDTVAEKSQTQSAGSSHQQLSNSQDTQNLEPPSSK